MRTQEVIIPLFSSFIWKTTGTFERRVLTHDRQNYFFPLFCLHHWFVHCFLMCFLLAHFHVVSTRGVIGDMCIMFRYIFFRGGKVQWNKRQILVQSQLYHQRCAWHADSLNSWPEDWSVFFVLFLFRLSLQCREIVNGDYLIILICEFVCLFVLQCVATRAEFSLHSKMWTVNRKC